MRGDTVIAVVGSGRPDLEPELQEKAYRVGAAVARQGAILLCGGLGGVMEEAARGAMEEGGLVVGILPGAHRYEANPFVQVAIATGMGEARNVILVRTADGVIALRGEAGTLSEIAMARKLGKPVCVVDGWEMLRDWEDLFFTDDIEEAVRWVLRNLR